MASPTKPARKKIPARPAHSSENSIFQNATAQMHDTIGASRSTNFTFKKDFVKDSMVVLGPERTFKLRNPLVHSTSAHKQSGGGLLQAVDDGAASLRAVSPFHTVPKMERPPSATRSYSLSSYDEIVRNATKQGRRWPSNHCFCLLGALFCVGMALAFGIYFGLINSKPEKLVEFVYRGTFRIEEGDWFSADLADVTSSAFSAKAREFEHKLDSILKLSPLKDIYHHSEILTFEGKEGRDLFVIFNLYCIMRKGAKDAEELEAVLKTELNDQFPSNVLVDAASIEVKARTPQMQAEGYDRPAHVDYFDMEHIHRNEPSGKQAPSSLSPSTRPPHGAGSAGNNAPVKKGQQPARPSPTSPVSINTFNRQQPPAERQGCVPISLEFCRQLGYNYTSFPNLLEQQNVREVDRLNGAAKKLIESECSPYIEYVLCHVLQPACEPKDNELGGFVPPPPPSKEKRSHHSPPCRSVCTAANASCRAFLGLDQPSLNARYDTSSQYKGRQKEALVEALHDLLRCDLFPADDGLGSCTAKPSAAHVMEAEPSECVMYMTANGQKNRVCDGMMDCHDFSDEVACNYCPEGQVHCGVGAACIDVQRRCDGNIDCPNGSDERGCLTVAPDMAAANFVHQYFHEGYVVYTEGNNTGKICVDSLNTSSLLSTARQQSFLEIFGESACRAMSYRLMEKIEIRTDNERSLDYAHLTEPVRWRATFLRAPCRKRQVLYLSCSGLECGTRPVHIHPDRPSTEIALLPSAHGDWPWFAALIRDGVHACDATLVADQWLLTSATCFDGQSRAHWVARFAAVRLTSDAPWEQERRIIGMVKSPIKSSQLVLIKMESSVIYSDFVRPICLARDHRSWISSEKSRCLFLGWGADGDNLHETTIQVTDNLKCDNVTTLCTKHSNSLNKCSNSQFAGSPMLCQVTEGGSWSLVGISGENRKCDENVQPTLNAAEEQTYHGISPIADWVMQTIRR